MIDITLIEKPTAKSRREVFEIKGASVSFLNALRRSIIEEVPTLAIEDVEIRKNTSAFYDEMIAHRLGLVPLTTDLKTYNAQDRCKCGGEGCALCTVTLTLKATGPGYVYASLLQAADPKVKAVYPEMPITKLLKGQKLEIEAIAVAGRGKIHQKWSPGLAWYKKKYQIKFDATKIKNPEEFAAKLPSKIAQVKAGKVNLDVNALLLSDLVEVAVEASKGALTAAETDDYIFLVESWGQMSPKEILLAAADSFVEKIEEFQKKIKE